MKKNLFLLMTVVSLLIVVACNSDDNGVNPPPPPPPEHTFPERYAVVPAWTSQTGNTIEVPATTGDAVKHLQVVYAERNGNYNYYTILMGHIDNVPIRSGVMVKYGGIIPVTLNRVEGTVTTESVKQSVTKAITETTFKSNTNTKNFGVNAGVTLFGLVELGGEAKITNTITNSLTQERSIIDTWETAHSQSSSSIDGVSVTIGDKDEPIGRYRWSLFATTDVYLSVKLNLDNTIIDSLEFSVCARLNSYTWDIDYDPDTIGSNEFPRLNQGEYFRIPEDFTSLAPPPEESRFVAVSSGGGIAYSDDGINWTEAHRHIGINWNDVVFADRMFVAVGDFGRIARSSNGITWTSADVIMPLGVASPTSIDWNGIAFGVINGNKTWVTVGSSNNTARAFDMGDGSEWLWSNSKVDINGADRPLNGVFYAKDRFVAAAVRGWIVHSIFGETWERFDTRDIYHNNAVVYGNDKFIMVADSGKIRRSPDGMYWTSATVGSNAWNGVVYGGGMYVAVGPAVSGAGKIAYSTDGIDWGQRDMGTSTWNDVAYGIVDGIGQWVAVGATAGDVGRMAYSANGIIWTEISVGTAGTDNWRAVTFGRY